MASSGPASTLRNDVTRTGRPRDDERRTALQAGAAAVLLERGSCEVSLRELADALGTSSRMLVHHFGSRDALIASALVLAREDLLASCRSRLAALHPRDLGELVRALREVMADPAHRPGFTLFTQVNALAQTQPERFPGFAVASVHDWLGQFTELLRDSYATDAEALGAATLALGIIRGLLQDGNATGESERIDAAFAVLDQMAAAAPHPTPGRD